MDVDSSMSPYLDKSQGKADVEAARSFQPPARPRIDTASTMAPGSSCLSFAASPVFSHQGSATRAERAEPLSPSIGRLNSTFDLPAADLSASPCDDEEEDILDVPVSRVSSPLHKVPRWAGRFTSADIAWDPLDGQDLVTVSQLEPGQQGLTVLAAINMIGTPSKPRPLPPKENAGPETPRTPRTTKTQRFTTPPPLVPKWKLPRPQLLQALQKNSVKDVRAVLQQSPEAASEPFWDHDVEPPLCCALRLRCEPAIVELLLHSGASPETKDMRGRTPVQILAQGSPSLVFPQGFSWPLASATVQERTFETWSQEVAGLLGT